MNTAPQSAALTMPATASPAAPPTLMAQRFRGFLPVVIDVECGGFHAATDALLEIAAVLIDITPAGELLPGRTHSFHVQPFEGARLDAMALSVNGIDPFHPLRPALPERDALQRVFREVRHALQAHGCTRAILVGHNAAFDLGFLNAAVARADLKRNPFHPFSCFDTATLAGQPWGRRCSQRRSRSPALTGMPARRTQPPTMRNARRSSSAACATGCTRAFVQPAATPANSAGSRLPRAPGQAGA